MKKRVCPHCGHDEIYVTTELVEAQQVISWNNEFGEPFETEEGVTKIFAKMPKYVCNFCYEFYDAPLVLEAKEGL